MINAKSIREKLSASNLYAARLAMQALDDGGQIETVESEIDCESLLRTYRIRLEHLKQFDSPHARDLSKTTAEFVANLESYQGSKVHSATIQGNRAREYLLFLTQDLSVIGCIQTVSKLKLSEDEWLELWGLNPGEA